METHIPPEEVFVKVICSGIYGTNLKHMRRSGLVDLD
jgi:hypothetical protein